MSYDFSRVKNRDCFWLIRQMRAFFQIAGSHLFEVIDENHPHNSLSLWERARVRVFQPGRTLVFTLIPE